MKITKRQSIMFTIILVCFILLGWEFYQLITHDNASFSALPEKNTLTQTLLRHHNAKVSIKTVTVQNTATPHIKNNCPVLTKNQKQYIDLINKIALAKMQRRLMEEEAAIAAAKNRIAILNAQTAIIAPSKLPDSKLYTLDEILLLELPATNYTIFLKGSFNKHDLNMLAQKQLLGAKAIYYSIAKKGQPWFILLYGHYNTKTEAQNTLQQLPNMLQRLNPQIEGMDPIQAAIKAQFGIHALLR